MYFFFFFFFFFFLMIRRPPRSTLFLHDALPISTVDSLQRQATLSVDPAAPAGVIIERDGNRVDGGTVIATAGVAFRLRVSAQDAYGNPVPTADLARMIQKMRNRFNLQSQLLKMISVESDGGAA